MNRTVTIADMYMSVLASLSNDDKLDLIGKLSASMHTARALKRTKAEKVSADPFACYKGDWSGGLSADELRSKRNFTDDIAPW